MSKATLKKALAGMQRGEMQEMILELYESDKNVKDYIEFWLNPDMDKMIDESKTALRKIYFVGGDGKPRPNPTAKDGAVIVKRIRNYGGSATQQIDIMIAELQTILDWLAVRHSYKGKDKIAVKRLETLVSTIVENDLMMDYEAPVSKMASRLENLMSDRVREVKRTRTRKYFIF